MFEKLKSPTVEKLTRYVLTAGMAAIVDLGGFAALLLGGMTVFWAAILSFMTANIVNYLLSSQFAFNRTPTLRRYPLFLAASALGLLVNITITVLCTWKLEADPVVSKIIGIAAAFLVNFGLNLRIVFVR